ncbi:ABC transporter permease [Acetobacter estunensis]|uniref:ABC transporter permease n=1 Tax=Acetobacter estunensis TaxID=104097 RepID=UPI001C2D5DD5|nr:ABC transporter permease [Acetobacter estunensis]MBV1836816.1 ABC transporter permease [Acetobacter estunensis]
MIPVRTVVPDVRSLVFRCLMLLPGAVMGLGLIVFSLGLVVFLAFRHNDGSVLGAGWTWSNFQTILTDPLYAQVALRSVVIAGTATAATVLAAYPVAYCIALRGGRWRSLLLFLVTLPFWTSYLLRVFAWKIVLAYNGVLNSVLVGSGILHAPSLAFLNTPAAVIVTLAHAYAPFAILPIYTALEGLPRSLLEAASDLGARPWTTFRRVVLPASVPGVLTASMVVFIPTLGDYVTPALVGGPRSIMIGSLIQMQFGRANDWPFGAALAVAVMLVVAGGMVLGRKLSVGRQG